MCACSCILILRYLVHRYIPSTCSLSAFHLEPAWEWRNCSLNFSLVINSLTGYRHFSNETLQYWNKQFISQQSVKIIITAVFLSNLAKKPPPAKCFTSTCSKQGIKIFRTYYEQFHPLALSTITDRQTNRQTDVHTDRQSQNIIVFDLPSLFTASGEWRAHEDSSISTYMCVYDSYTNTFHSRLYVNLFDSLPCTTTQSSPPMPL